MRGKFFVIKADFGNKDFYKEVFVSYLKRDCSGVLNKNILYIAENQAQILFQTQERFLSFCRNGADSKRFKVSRAEVPGLSTLNKKFSRRRSKRTIFYE